MSYLTADELRRRQAAKRRTIERRAQREAIEMMRRLVARESAESICHTSVRH